MLFRNGEQIPYPKVLGDTQVGDLMYLGKAKHPDAQWVIKRPRGWQFTEEVPNKLKLLVLIGGV